MTLDRRALKLRAKDIIRTSRPSVISVAAVVLLLNIIIGTLSARLMGLNISQSELNTYTQYVMDGNTDAALQYLSRMQPPGGAHLIDLLLTIVKTVLQAGFIIFLLNTIRGNEPCFGNLLDGFGFFVKVILLSLLTALFIILWGLLLIIPGFIAIYRYSMAMYILVDDPTKSPMQCLRESSRMMQGHKMEYFILMLSFFGWAILAALPTVGYLVQIWSLPYIAMTQALYYERIAYGDRHYEEPVYSYSE